MISNKPLSGSPDRKEIKLSKTPTLIHETPENLEYCEIWLYAINRTDKPIELVLNVNDEDISVQLATNDRSPQDLYGGTGAITYSGDKFYARSNKEEGLSLVGWVIEVKNG